MRSVSMFENMKLRRKLTITMGGILLISMGVLILFSTYNFRKNSVKEAKELADTTAEHYSGHIENKMSNALTAARVLAQLFEEYEIFPEQDRRKYFNEELKKITQSNEDFLSVWVDAEQNSIDNLDSVSIGKEGSNDVGRFIAGWYKVGNEIKMSDGVEAELITEDYYTIPKEKKQEVVLEPYYDSYVENSPEILMTSVIVPIMKNGEYKGAVGIDISLEFFKELLKDVRPFETGYTAILSNKGSYIYSAEEKKLGKKISEIDKESDKKFKISENILNGKSFSYEEVEKNNYVSYVPIEVSSEMDKWSFVVEIPMSQVLKSSNEMSKK